MTSVYDRIYIGDQFIARNKKLLQSHNITHIINCTSEIFDFHPEDFTYHKLNLCDDSGDDLKSVVEPTYELMSLILSNPKNVIFIHCSMGISRSSTVILYYIMKKEQINFEEALKNMHLCYPKAKPNIYYESYLKSL